MQRVRMRSIKRSLIGIGMGVAVVGGATWLVAAERSGNVSMPERAAIDSKYQWDLEALYSNTGEWQKAHNSFKASIKTLEGCKGKLKQSTPEVVKPCLEAVFNGRRQLSRLQSYAERSYDQDTRVTKNQVLKSQVEQTEAKLSSATAFVEPELLSLPVEKLKALAAAPALKDYDFYLKELLRKRKHVLSPEEEKVLAQLTPMFRAGYNLYTTLTTAEMQFPEVMVDGKKVKLSQALFGRYRGIANRDERKRVFEAFFGAYGGYKQTLANILSTNTNNNIISARIRQYPSALAAAIDDGNVPEAVYNNLLAATQKYLPLLHRYMKLRAKLLGVDQLHYYDLYTPMIQEVAMRFPYDKSREVVVEGMSALGPEVTEVLKTGLDPKNGWVDVYPNQGKRSGAYMSGEAYDVHPFVLLNHLDTYESMTTLAHEMGHAIHSFLSNKYQPYPKADYPIFVAEVASTVGEALLMEDLLAKAKDDPKKRLFLLGQRMESFRTTFFRQAMFAEFEREMYRAAERDEALTADYLSALYLKIARKIYGHDKKVVTIDDRYGVEWAYIPHFYYNFYVYQYATGITAATALAETIRGQGTAARDRYVTNLLKGGGSDYPIELLRRAGVDLRSSKPYDAAMKVFERTIAEAEKLVAAK